MHHLCVSTYRTSLERRAPVHWLALSPRSATVPMENFSHGSLHRLYCMVTWTAGVCRHSLPERVHARGGQLVSHRLHSCPPGGPNAGSKRDAVPGHSFEWGSSTQSRRKQERACGRPLIQHRTVDARQSGILLAACSPPSTVPDFSVSGHEGPPSCIGGQGLDRDPLEARAPPASAACGGPRRRSRASCACGRWRPA